MKVVTRRMFLESAVINGNRKNRREAARGIKRLDSHANRRKHEGRGR